MAREGDVDAGFCRRFDCVIMAADGFAQLPALADGHGEQGVVGYEDACFFGCNRGEALFDHLHLVMIDAPVLDRQRTGRVDAQDRDLFILIPGAKLIADIAFVAFQGGGETADHVIERHVMVARNDEQAHARRA